VYGMVNKAVEEMVCSHYGEDTWAQVKATAGVDADVFISTDACPDELTYRLVAAAAEVLNLPAEEVLDAFGVHWVLHTARAGYGDLLAAGGSTLPEFLGNLPGFHARVALIYPNLKPPTFQVSDVTATSLHLHYYSHRAGLQPFVRGLVRSLAAMFATDAETTTVQTREAGADHDEFLVRWTLAPSKP
jgi:hypothetical protein